MLVKEKPCVVIGNMWDVYRTQGHLWCFTTNSRVKNNGCLTMGKGIAGSVAKTYPHIPGILGEKIRSNGQSMGVYGLYVLSNGMAAFQTKKDWRDNSDIEIIKYSSEQLMKYLDSSDEYNKADLAFPGIGLGRLNEHEVYDVISDILDNRVILWKFR